MVLVVVLVGCPPPYFLKARRGCPLLTAAMNKIKNTLKKLTSGGGMWQIRNSEVGEGKMASDYKRQIEESTRIVCRIRKSMELFNNEELISGVEQQRYEIYREQIHEYLSERGGRDSEAEIQEHIKAIFKHDLPICETKVNKYQNLLGKLQKQKRPNKQELDDCYRSLQTWLILYEGFYALVAYRSLEHFANYMEWDKPDEEKVWKYSIDPYNDGGYTGVNKPFFYYFNQMVLKRNIKFISKQQPTGTGKSYSNAFAIAWLLGNDMNNDILLVLGNPTLVSTNMNTIVEIMKNPRFAEVFPKFSKYLEEITDKKGNTIKTLSDNMFSTCRIKDGELTLADSEKAMNLKVISKDVHIDGVRVRYLFLDDICRSADAGNMKQHQKDIDMYWKSWWRRNYNTRDFYIVIGCTAYSIFDIASSLIAYYSKGKMKKTAVNKYTYSSMDDSCIFIKIPKIDEDLDRSTYPQKFPYEDAIQLKERDYKTFMAMEQQQPLPPDNSPFYIDNLQSYEIIPEDGRSEFCWAALDTARIGFDYNSMPIFCKVGDKFYLKDCLYLNEPMDTMYEKIVDKIAQHKITKLVVEKNIDVSLRALLTKLLQERGINYCEIIEVYATIKKEEKIYNMEQTIKNFIVFPANGLYSYVSQMGKFMNDVYSFSYIHKNEHDDSIDSVATFCQRMIVLPQKKSKAKLLYL